MEKDVYAQEDGQLYFWADLPEFWRDEQSYSLIKIPSDDDSPFTLSITTHSGAFGDAFITYELQKS